MVDSEEHLLHVLARSVFVALHACGDNVDDWMALVEDVRRQSIDIPTSMQPKDKYRWFLQLKGDHPRTETLPFYVAFQSAVASMAYDVVMALPATACLFDTLAKQRFLMHVIAMHFGNISQNISIKNMFDRSEPMTFCLMASMFNHRCYPNVMYTLVGGDEVCITIRPVKSGEQLFTTYVGLQNQRTRDSVGPWVRGECDGCLPVVLPSHQLRAMETSDHFRAIRRTMPLGELPA